MKDVLIKNGTVVSAEMEYPADVLISNGLITQIGPDLAAPSGAEVIDAQGFLLMPGGVDVHTHLDLTVGKAHVSDGWYAGSLAAAFGGNTSLIEHPGFGPKNCPPDYQLNIYRKNALEAVVDYGLHGVFQHWDQNVAGELKHLVAEGYPSFKAYMTYDGRLADSDFLEALKALGEAGGLMTVHAENHAIVSYLAARLRLSVPHLGASFPKSRPDYAEALAIETAIALAQAAGNAPLYIVHLSTAKGLAAIRRAKKEGRAVWAETCPQYLTLTEACYDENFDEAVKYVMAPVLRKSSDVEALWEGLADGSIDTVATDHCSYAWEDKKNKAQGNIFQSPGGIPGVETRLPILYSEGVVKRGLSRSRFVDLVSSTPARLFGLPNKGSLNIGKDADLIIFDPKKEKKIKAEQLHQAVDYTPFEDMVVCGWPREVFLRGKKIIEDGERFIGEPGQGKFMARQPFKKN